MLKYLPLLLTSLCGAQTITILPGDSCFSTSSVWPTPVLQWGPSFTCTKQLAAGQYDLLLTFQEPNPPVGIGQRVFTVSFNGQTSQPIDIVKAVGLGTLQIAAKATQTFDGPFVMRFAATVRNAVVSSIIITPSAIPQGPPGPQGAPGAQGIPGKDGKDGASGPPGPATTANLLIESGAQIQALACPAGYAGPAKLMDGTCLTAVPRNGPIPIAYVRLTN